MITAAEIAEELGARKTGPGKWTARCPAHGDNKPSLSISEGECGKLLLYCHVGCPFEYIRKALGYGGLGGK